MEQMFRLCIWAAKICLSLVTGKSTCLWHVVDWVEEVHHISQQLQCTFNHVLREANDLADCLARGSFILNFCLELLYLSCLVFVSSILVSCFAWVEIKFLPLPTKVGRNMIKHLNLKNLKLNISIKHD